MKWATSLPVHRPLFDEEREKWPKHKQRRVRVAPAIVPLTGTELLLLQNLARKESDEKGYAWPSRRTLAREQGCTVDTIDRKIKLLERAGLLEVTRGQGVHGRSNRYRLKVPCEIRHRDANWMNRHPCPGCCEAHDLPNRS